MMKKLLMSRTGIIKDTSARSTKISIIPQDIQSPPPILAAYQEIYSNMWCGFSADAKAEAYIGSTINGTDGLFLNIDPANSPWVSLEFGIHRKTLSNSNSVTLTLNSACSPHSKIHAVLRIPDKSDHRGFRDCADAYVTLSGDMEEVAIKLDADLNKVRSTKKLLHPTLILFFPLRPISVCICSAEISIR